MSAPAAPPSSLVVVSSLYDASTSPEEIQTLWKRVKTESDRRSGEGNVSRPEPGLKLQKGINKAFDLQRHLNERQHVVLHSETRFPTYVRPDFAGEVQCVTASYEDSFLRPPRPGERACLLGKECVGLSENISGWSSVQSRVLVEFKTPAQVRRDQDNPSSQKKTGLCVLCTRLAVDTAFLKHTSGAERGCGEEAYFDQINEYCNPVDTIDGYRADVCLPPPGASSVSACTRLVGAVCGLKYSLLEWKQDANGEWWIDQHRAKYVLPDNTRLVSKPPGRLHEQNKHGSVPYFQ